MEGEYDEEDSPETTEAVKSESDLSDDEESEDEQFTAKPVVLTFDDACKGLCMLGKTANGLQHAYLKIRLVDQNLCDVAVITGFRHVLIVDLSGNMLDDDAVQVLATMQFLVVIQVDRNNLTSARLPPMEYLQLLLLNQNYIEDITGSVEHTQLTCLELSHNRIINAAGLDRTILTNLRTLDLSHNQLTSVADLELDTLENLYLCSNSIKKFKGLRRFPRLKVLHMRGNPLKRLKGISKKKLPALEYLNVRECELSSLDQFSVLADLPTLATLVITDNPAIQDTEEGYRPEVLSYVRQLKRLDKLPVLDEELEEAAEIRTARELRGDEEEAGDEEEDG